VWLSLFSIKPGGNDLLVVWPQNHRDGFFGLGHKTKVNGLVIWTSKSPRWFFGLNLKTKWEEVCRFTPQNR
jgi:hypothetical protein